MSLNDKLWGWLGKKPEGDFTTDLSLCFKWLVPRIRWDLLDDDYGQKVTIYQRGREWGCYLGDWKEYQIGETPALALCLAILNLIEKDIDK